MNKEEDKVKQYRFTEGTNDVFKYRDIMEAVANKFDGRFRIIRTGEGKIYECHILEIPYRNCMLLMKVSDTRPLRMEMEFKASTHFDLTVSHEDFIERIIKKIINRDIETGWPEFDKKFMIQSNKVGIAKKLLSHKIQEGILELNIHSLSIQTDEDSRDGRLISIIRRQPTLYNETIRIIDYFKSLVDSMTEAHIMR